jgi:nitroreductase
MTFDDFKTLCENRRSIRYFADQPVDKADIEKLLQLARLAPSVENLQPWHFHVILSEEMRSKLMKASCYGNFVEGAGAFIVVTVNPTYENKAAEPVWNRRELEYSCMAAMENMLLGATAIGLASCWVSLHHGKAHDILGLPHHELIVGGVMIGHYRPNEQQPSDGRQRRPLEEMRTFHV